MRALLEVCAGGSAPLPALHFFIVFCLFYNDFAVFHRCHFACFFDIFFGLRRGVRRIYIWRFARPAPGSAPGLALKLFFNFPWFFLVGVLLADCVAFLFVL